MSKEIKLTQGFVTQVDDEDYPWASKFTWHLSKGAGSNTWYARTSIRFGSKIVRVLLHQLVIDKAFGYDDESYLEIDHADNDGLNNCRDNLRFVSHNLNIHNTPKRKGTSSIYRGVYFNSGRGKFWKAGIRIKGQYTHLGVFDDEEDGARAYDKAALKVYGAATQLNFKGE